MSQNSTGKFSSALFRPAFGVIAGALLLTASFEASAQVVYNEGFEQAPLTGATAASTAPYPTRCSIPPYGLTAGSPVSTARVLIPTTGGIV